MTAPSQAMLPLRPAVAYLIKYEAADPETSPAIVCGHLHRRRVLDGVGDDILETVADVLAQWRDSDDDGDDGGDADD